MPERGSDLGVRTWTEPVGSETHGPWTPVLSPAPDQVPRPIQGSRALTCGLPEPDLPPQRLPVGELERGRWGRAPDPHSLCWEGRSSRERGWGEQGHGPLPAAPESCPARQATLSLLLPRRPLRLQSHAASRRPGPRLLAALSFTEAASWESTNAAAGEPAHARTAARGARQERPRGDQRAMPGRTAPQAGGRQGGRAERSCCRALGGLSAPTRCRARAEPALSRRDSAATVSNVGPRISGHFPERSTKPRSRTRGHAPQFLAPTAPRHPNVSSGGTG